jgi:hypothetical protein
LIGGLPLLQTLSITFTGSPIPFGKLQFPPKGLADLFAKIKEVIQKGKDVMDMLKQEFVNPIKQGIDEVKAKLDAFTANNYQGLKDSLPAVFNDARAGVVSARNSLMGVIGSASTATDQKFLGMNIGDLSTLGATLYEAHKAFDNHTSEISGVANNDKAYTFERLYGEPTIPFTTVTVYSASTSIQPSLTALNYPIINVGELVVVNSQTRRITGKIYAAHPTGTVSIDTSANSSRLSSSSLVFLNLANILLETGGGGTVKLSPNMYINVNSEIRQVNTINATGDYLTVYHPFKYSATSVTLNKEIGLNANAVFASTITTQIKHRTQFMANSLCLDNVITGNGTTFLSSLSPGDKIYYDNREFYVISLTDTQIVVDDVLKSRNNQVLYKVTEETPLYKFTESNSPEDILGLFSSIDQLTGTVGSNVTGDLTTRYRASDGTYYTINASSPKDLTTSLQRNDLNARTSQVLQTLLDRLQDDAIRSLNESDLVAEINSVKNDINDIKNELNDAIKKDLAAINSVKGLLSGLLKLFAVSCSKKKKKDNNTSSDEYLDLILAPNPIRQGCDATESDFIDILDDIDAEHNNPDIAQPDIVLPDDGIVDDDIFLSDELESNIYGDEPEEEAGPAADIIIDDEPVVLPPAPDPCTQPC